MTTFSKTLTGSLSSALRSFPRTPGFLAATVLVLATSFIGAAAPGAAQEQRNPPEHRDIATLIDSLYMAVSFEPGEVPDWERVRGFFLEDAVVVFAPRGRAPARVMDLDAFILDFQTFYADAGIATNGFRENLASKRITEYGNVGHALVVFEPRVGPDWDGPTTPGLDSVSLVRVDGRWWVASIATQFSSEDMPIPDELRGG